MDATLSSPGLALGGEGGSICGAPKLILQMGGASLLGVGHDLQCRAPVEPDWVPAAGIAASPDIAPCRPGLAARRGLPPQGHDGGRRRAEEGGADGRWCWGRPRGQDEARGGGPPRAGARTSHKVTGTQDI